MERKELTVKWSLISLIFSLAWPTMLEQLMQTAVQYIDTAMVGSLGTEATAAVGSTSTVNWLISSTISAIGVGFLACIAKATGEGNLARARKAAMQAVLAVVVAGTFFTVLTLSFSRQVPLWMHVDPNVRELASAYFLILYLPMLPRTASIIFGTVLRASGDTRTPMRTGVLVNLVNVLLNFALIFPVRTVTVAGIALTVPGAGLGVIGAAAASAVAYTVGGICMTAALWKHPDVSPRGQSFYPDREVLGSCLRVAVPNMLQRFATSLGYVFFAAMINALGQTSTAAHTIANTVESAFYIPGYGMMAAAATLTGQAYGARDRSRMRRLGSAVMILEASLMVLSGGLLFFFAEPMVRIFSRQESVVLLGTRVLKMVALSEPFYGVSIVIEGMLQGVGKTAAPFVFHVIGMWCIRIAGTFVCTCLLNLGLVSAWGCMIAHNLLLFVCFFLYYRFASWNPLEPDRRQKARMAAE